MPTEPEENEVQVTWPWIWRFSQFGIGLAGIIWLVAQMFWDINQLKKDVLAVQTSVWKIERKIDIIVPNNRQGTGL